MCNLRIEILAQEAETIKGHSKNLNKQNATKQNKAKHNKTKQNKKKPKH